MKCERLGRERGEVVSLGGSGRDGKSGEEIERRRTGKERKAGGDAAGGVGGR